MTEQQRFAHDHDRRMADANAAALDHLRWCARQARIVDRAYWEARRRFGSMNGHVSMIKTDRFRYRFAIQERLREKAEVRRNRRSWGLV